MSAEESKMKEIHAQGEGPGHVWLMSVMVECVSATQTFELYGSYPDLWPQVEQWSALHEDMKKGETGFRSGNGTVIFSGFSCNAERSPKQIVVPFGRVKSVELLHRFGEVKGLGRFWSVFVVSAHGDYRFVFDSRDEAERLVKAWVSYHQACVSISTPDGNYIHEFDAICDTYDRSIVSCAINLVDVKYMRVTNEN